ncbi:helix-turn-helix domain-containing protein [Mucilaginibacter sp. HMF5004]|uniref:helix-turn-helix domain-containing protein n=1 Tax=Mucilaginibacter rivuli TaxID=2857527 RepID=UPI001C5DEA3A|nr:helix-turn-helix domain-containing protein [Mucilaginibacter rivuli]MBW4888966.1 helix-turn-helix domain-containing protein [Mucilaginibacter rivuli]
MEKITFEQLPDAVALLLEKVERIEHLLTGQSQCQSEDLLTIKQAADFLDLAVPTLYSKVCRNEVPVNKRGKRLYFYKSELTDWVKGGRRDTALEMIKKMDFKHSVRRRKP